jgi:hypothetical protein
MERAAMRRIRLVSDDDCRRDLGGFSLMRWHRWQKKFADLIPPPIIVGNRKFREAHLWEKAKRKLLEQSNSAALRERAHRELAAKRVKQAQRLKAAQDEAAKVVERRKAQVYLTDEPME